MSNRLGLSRRLVTAAGWPFGIAITSWSYLWRTTPMHRAEVAGSLEADSPPDLPPGTDERGLQLPETGHGSLFHRRYSVHIAGSAVSPGALIERLKSDLDAAAPHALASFHKVRGDEGEMRVGDEYVVRMPGPWDGPVRVVEVEPRAFRMATLQSHVEAGQIRMSAASEGREIEFAVEAWTRSGDRVSDLLHTHLRMAKEVQLHMWTSFLERVVKLCDGRMVDGLSIITRRVDDPSGETRLLADETPGGALAALHDRPVNFDVSASPDAGDGERGWYVDHLCQALPDEPPGDPVPGGAWEVARRLVEEYEFADPSLIRAIYRPDDPLEGRDMLLEARFAGLTFHLGVRAGGVRDETRTVDGQAVRVWGWEYRTLEGHLEAGQMRYEVWKWLATGAVEFRIDRFVRPARIPNLIVRTGFRLFGRRLQMRFARRACERMAVLTAEALGDTSVQPISRAADAIAVRPHIAAR
jgi:uncharacterized protein (UPF0548 family)